MALTNIQSLLALWGLGMLQSFAHRVFVVLTAIVLLVLLGWGLHAFVENGHLGVRAQQRLAWIWVEMRDLIAHREFEFTLAGKLAGAMATLLAGAWTLHKSLYFANRQLPRRLADYLDQREELLTRMLPLRLAELRQSHHVKRGDLVLLYGPLKRALAKEALPAPRQFRRDIQAVIGDLESRAGIVARTADLIRAERVSAHVLHGASILAQAALLGRTQEAERQRMLGAAIGEFDQALELDQNNLDALELKAELRRSTGDEDPGFLERFCEAANRSGDVLWQAKANRMLAEHFAEHPVRARVVEARGYIERAIDCLTELSAPSHQLKRQQAELHGLAARIYKRLDRYGLMRASLDSATRLYQEMGEQKPIDDLIAATTLDPSDRDEAP